MNDVSAKRARRAWYLYDAGNSAYAAVVLLAIYATYFQEHVVVNNLSMGSFLWGIAITTATAIVAVLSPILGTIADVSGRKKLFLFRLTAMSCLFTASLFFVTPGAVALGMALLILAEVGYRGSQVFYNSLLPDIATENEMGRVSGNGWAIGSAGGVVCLLIVLAAVMAIGGALVTRLAMVFTAVYFALFTIPLFRRVQEKGERRPLPKGMDLVKLPFQRLAQTFRAARQYREFGKFLLAFLIYNEGILITLSYGAILGKTLFGLQTEGIIVFMIVVQLASIPGAFVPGLMIRRIGVRNTLLLSLAGLLAGVLWLFFAESVIAFYVIGAIAGFCLTGVQSVSRGTVGMLAPAGRSAEFYGFFALAGRTSSAVGPAIFGSIVLSATNALQRSGQPADAAVMGAHRYALLTIVVFLVVGGALLLRVTGKAGRGTPSKLARPDGE